MQESYVISSPVSNTSNIATAINTVLATTASGWGPWCLTTSFCSGSTAYFVFVRNQIPTTGASAYVVT